MTTTYRRTALVFGPLFALVSLTANTTAAATESPANEKTANETSPAEPAAPEAPAAPLPGKAPKAPKPPAPPKAPAAPKAPTVRLEGRLPDKLPNVDLVLENDSVGDALEQLADQAGWSLLVSTDRIDETITLKIKQVPADEALEAILEAGKLRAKFKRNTLSVFSGPEKSNDFEFHVEVPNIEAPDIQVETSDEERVSNGEDLEIGEDESVDSAVATGGNLIVRGRVRNDAVSIGGNVTLKPGAHVDGDAVALGGKVSVERGAVLKGNRTSFGGSFSGLLKAISKSKGKRIVVHGDDEESDGHPSSHHNSDDDHGHPHKDSENWFFGAGGALMRGFLGFLLCLMFAGFVPERLSEVREMLRRRPQYAGFVGLLIGLCFIPLLAFLTLTLVGIPLVPVVAVLFVVAMSMGYVVLAQWIGEKLPIFVNRKTPLAIAALGTATITFFDFIPYLGFISITIACLFAAGGTILTRYGKPGAVDQLAPSVLG